MRGDVHVSTHVEFDPFSGGVLEHGVASQHDDPLAMVLVVPARFGRGVSAGDDALDRDATPLRERLEVLGFKCRRERRKEVACDQGDWLSKEGGRLKGL